MRVLGLVTARGGSKGFPGKNLARLAGRPLVCWSHRALAGLRERRPGLVVRLSTDCESIAGAWPEGDRPGELRPAALAGDAATSLSVVEHELERMAGRGEPCGAVLLVQPTCPLVTAVDLDALWRGFEDSGGFEGNGSAVLAAEFDHPHAWSFRADGRGRVEPMGAWGTARRQDESAGLRPIGCYMVSAGFLREHGAFVVPGETAVVEIPRERAVDIDEAGDLEIAAAAMRRASGERGIVIRSGVVEKTIGEGEAVFVIAEAGVNHNGDAGLAEKLVDAAAEAGADAVKFQTFNVSSLVSGSAEMAGYQKKNMGERGEGTQAAMLERLRLADDALPGLKARAEARGLVFLSSPFDIESARVLAGLGVGALKIGSGELTNLPFLRELAGLGVPMLVSTGMGNLDEVEDAAAVIAAGWGGDGVAMVGWLHCVSAYPAPEAASNLAAMESIRAAVGGPVGMSDHSFSVDGGWAVTLAAVARGARVIEKHLTLGRSMGGPDHAASLEPGEFGEMMRQVRLVESAIGDGVKRAAACETDTMAAARRSLVAARDLPAGHVLAAGDVVCKRPGTGLRPGLMEAVVGKKLARGVATDEVLKTGDVAGL